MLKINKRHPSSLYLGLNSFQGNLLVIVVLSLIFACNLHADEYVRSKSDLNGNYIESFQTAIIHLHKDDLAVDLVGAVHVGDKAYYQELNKLFKNYDAVLFELVAESDKVQERIVKRPGFKQWFE